MHNLQILAGIAFNPGIRGILVVAVGVGVLMGSVYLLLATNVGARLGLLLTFTGLFGWLTILTLIWWITPPAIGPRGNNASWKPVEIYTNSSGVPKTVQVGGLVDPSALPSSDVILADNPELAGKAADNYRKIYEGQVAGSDYYIVGGVTELNSNISSNGVDLSAGRLGVKSTKGTFESRNYVINVAIDLRLVNTRTQEVVDIVSYQKQLVGHELKAGVFGFANGVIMDLSGGASSMEPLQMAVRTLVERAVFEFGETLYGFDARSCLVPKAKSKFRG
jgi:hypothetical protein